jgi:uncharacterized protein YqgC (DUF456 family)
MTRDYQNQILIAVLSVAMASPMLLPAFPGAVIACAALLCALWLFVRARALRAWLVVALIGAAVAAASQG